MDIDTEMFSNYKMRLLNSNDTEEIQCICEKCNDYYILDNGIGTDKNAAKEILEALPPNKSYDDQYNLGMFDKNNVLSAVINIIDGYPEEGVWMLGLLLVSPEKRRIGLGKFFHNDVVEFVKSKNGKKIRIAIFDDNTTALEFWKSLDYKYEKEGKSERDNNIIKTLLVYSLIL